MAGATPDLGCSGDGRAAVAEMWQHRRTATTLSLSPSLSLYIYLLPKVDAASDVLMVAAGVAHGGGNRGGATSSDEI